MDFIQIYIFVKTIENVERGRRSLFHLLRIITNSGFWIFYIFLCILRSNFPRIYKNIELLFIVFMILLTNLLYYYYYYIGNREEINILRILKV